jgi:CRISPR/Cas system-associated exonuclease Cas4 (RecB family)
MNRYSASRLKTFDGCNLKFKLVYVDQIQTEQVFSPEAEFGSFFHKFAELYDGTNLMSLIKLNREFKLTDDYKKEVSKSLKHFIEFFNKYKKLEYRTEKEYELKTDDFWIHGIVDRVMFGEDQTILVDYKTSKFASSEYHLFQMKLYNLILAENLQKAPSAIKTIIYFPRPNQEEKLLFTDIQMENFKKELVQKIETIETCKDWKATKSYGCKWCNFFNTKHCQLTYRG